MVVPKVSVCMAPYNHVPFIRVAVENALNQTFTDWELVLTADGLSDGTIDARDGIRDGRARIERFPENRSASSARAIRRSAYGFCGSMDGSHRHCHTWIQRISAPSSSSSHTYDYPQPYGLEA
jgi:glycosyltransferase involved in cell wall biosynthesis